MRISTCLATVVLFAVTGCHFSIKSHHHESHGQDGHAHGHDVTRAVATIHPTDGNVVRGVVVMTKVSAGVKIVAELRGFEPNTVHAIHVHELGDTSSKDGSSAGGHFNPDGHDHGLPGESHRHAGDLGNLTADASGSCRYELTVDNLTLGRGKRCAIGRSIVIHEFADTGKGESGEAGPRIAYGTIGIAN